MTDIRVYNNPESVAGVFVEQANGRLVGVTYGVLKSCARAAYRLAENNEYTTPRPAGTPKGKFLGVLRDGKWVNKGKLKREDKPMSRVGQRVQTKDGGYSWGPCTGVVIKDWERGVAVQVDEEFWNAAICPEYNETRGYNYTNLELEEKPMKTNVNRIRKYYGTMTAGEKQYMANKLWKQDQIVADKVRPHVDEDFLNPFVPKYKVGDVVRIVGTDFYTVIDTVDSTDRGLPYYLAKSNGSGHWQREGQLELITINRGE